MPELREPVQEDKMEGTSESQLACTLYGPPYRWELRAWISVEATEGGIGSK